MWGDSNSLDQDKNYRLTRFIARPALSWWLAVVLLLAGLGGGILIGENLSPITPEKIIIKGGAANTTGTTSVINSTVTPTIIPSSTLTTLPAYLKKDVDFQLYWDTWNTLKNKAFDKNIPDTKLFYGSLEGMVASLADPYSVFMTPTDATQFQQDLQGNFEGIGAEIAVKNNQLVIVSPLEDSPAMKAGLRPKDWILKINGTSTDGMSSSEAVSLIRGPAGTKVTLTIYREGFAAPQDFTITRAAINVKSVSGEYLAGGIIAHIKVRQFNNDTMSLFDSAISNILSKPSVKGVILDLRGNPGGYLDSAVQMAGEWDGQAVVVSEKDRNGITTDHQAMEAPRLAGYKTVILVDGGSASASEIVAGALKDWGKATIVGMKTFGKGSVQDLTQLADGSQIKLTIAKWFTPKGTSIDEQGIEPDVKVDLTLEDYNNDRDPQLDKAVELLR